VNLICSTAVDLVTDEGVPRAIEKSTIESFAQTVGAVGVFETSAKKNQGVCFVPSRNTKMNSREKHFVVALLFVLVL
jgi:hypothetical protein